MICDNLVLVWELRITIRTSASRIIYRFQDMRKTIMKSSYFMLTNQFLLFRIIMKRNTNPDWNLQIAKTDNMKVYKMSELSNL